MKTTDLSAVVAAVPVNRSSARVISRGIDYTPAVDDSQQRRSPAPLPTKPFPLNSVATDNLTGARFGRFSVIGLLDRKAVGGGKAARWVCRCSCGYYETRSAAVLRDPTKARSHMCSHCDYLEELKAGRVPARTPSEADRRAKLVQERA